MADRSEYFKKNRKKLNKQKREWALKNKDKVREAQKKWEKNNREKRNKITRDYYRKIKSNKKKYYCRYLAHKAEKKGLLKKENCVVCGNKKSEKHHPNYNKPLEVIWMCHKCHIRLHLNKISL